MWGCAFIHRAAARVTSGSDSAGIVILPGQQSSNRVNPIKKWFTFPSQKTDFNDSMALKAQNNFIEKRNVASVFPVVF